MATALWIRGQIAAKRDWDYESAERYYKRAIKIIEPIQDDLIAQNMFTFLGMLAYAYAAAGRTNKTENLITDLRKKENS